MEQLRLQVEGQWKNNEQALDRMRLQAEVQWKNREFAIRERELALQERELQLEGHKAQQENALGHRELSVKAGSEAEDRMTPLFQRLVAALTAPRRLVRGPDGRASHTEVVPPTTE
jgi:hypothetical protein